MQFRYTSDKDAFPVIGAQDSKYLPLPADEPAKVQLHSVTSKKLRLTICSDSLSLKYAPKKFSYFIYEKQ